MVSLANSKFDGSSVGPSVFCSAVAVIKTVGPSKSVVVAGISVDEIVGFDCVSIAGTIGISTVIYERFRLEIIIIISI